MAITAFILAALVGYASAETVVCDTWLTGAVKTCSVGIVQGNCDNAATAAEDAKCSVTNCCLQEAVMILCADWAKKTKAKCDSGVVTDKKCNSVPGKEVCSTEMCCNPPGPATIMTCGTWIEQFKIGCTTATAGKKCIVGATGDEACIEDNCCPAATPTTTAAPGVTTPGVTNNQTMVECGAWVTSAEEFCENGVDPAKKCAKGGTGADACNTGYCCKKGAAGPSAPKPTSTNCKAWMSDVKMVCKYGNNNTKKCMKGGTGGDACSKSLCCVPTAQISCTKWVKSEGVKCSQGVMTGKNCVKSGSTKTACSKTKCCRSK